MAVRVLVCLALATLAALPPAPGGAAPLRVAVVDAGGEAAAPAALLDLLTLELGSVDGLEPLERGQLEAVIREQELSLSLAREAKRGDFAAAGKTLGADALVLLIAERPTDDQQQLVRVRVVETRRGVRCGEGTIALSAEGDQLPAAARDAARQAAEALDRMRSAEGKLVVVAFAGLRGDASSSDAVRLRRDLQAGLEAWLGAQPGVAVAERRRVLPLIGERRLASDQPTPFGDADAVIDGELKLDFESQTPVAELRLRLIEKEGGVKRKAIRTEYRSLKQLQDAAGAAVLDLLKWPTAEVDTTREAAMLTAEAERLLRFWRKYEAAERLRTAYALAPDNRRVHALLLRAGVQLGVGPDPSGDTFRGAFYPAMMLQCDVARRVLDRIDEPIPGAETDRSLRKGALLARTGDLCKMMSQIQFVVKQLGDADPMQHEWVRAAVSDLYDRYLVTAKAAGGEAYEAALYRGLQSGLYWAESPRHALRLRRKLFMAAAELSTFGSFGGWCFTGDFRFRVTDIKAWKSTPGLTELHDEHFGKLAEASSPVVRAVGFREAANDALWRLGDRDLALDRYRRFIRVVTDEIVTEHSPWADEVHGLWLDLNDKRGSLALGPAEAGELWSRVLRARWLPEPPRNPQPWEYRIGQTVKNLEKAEKPSQAVSLLDDLAGSLQRRADALAAASRQTIEGEERFDREDRQAKQKHDAEELTWSRRRLLKQRAKLLERHPGLAPDGEETEATIAAECREVLPIRGLFSPKAPPTNQPPSGPTAYWRYAGLVKTDDGMAVCGVGQLPQTREQRKRTTRFTQSELSAVAWLDTEGALRTIARHDEPIEHDYRRSRQSSGPWGPQAGFVASADGLFVGPPMGGVVWFRPNDVTVHFASSHLGSADPQRVATPFEEVHQLVASRGKLYVVADRTHEVSALYELDYGRATCRELFSTDALPSEHPLRGRHGLAVRAGPPGKLIVWGHWVGDHQSGRHPDGPLGPNNDLFLLDPADEAISSPPKPVKAPFGFQLRSPLHQLTHQEGNRLIAVYAPKRLEFDLLGAATAADVARLQRQHGAQATCLAANDRLVVVRSQNEWRVYRRDDGSSKKLRGRNLPEPRRVSAFLLDDQDRLWLLTHRSLLRVSLPDREPRRVKET